jgi:D-alanine-D-alanine ligase
MLRNSAGAAQPRREPAHGASRNEDVLQGWIERLMPRLRLAVVFGGDKSIPGSVIYQSPNTRSWKSYEAVAADIASSLQRIGFRHVEIFPEDMNLGDRLRRSDIHMAWLNTGGVQGYDSAAHAPALLESLGVPYVGHDPLNASTLDNKHTFKREAASQGFATAPFVTWDMARGPFRPGANRHFNRVFADYDGPFVVKPVSGRASLHVFVAEDRDSLPDIVAQVYGATDNLVLIEKYLSGREYCIAVSGPVTARHRKLVRGREPFAFAALERVLAADEKIFTSMDVRPITQDRFRILDAKADRVAIEKLRRLACEVFVELNLNSLVRLDVRCDDHGVLNILEANPKPDLKRPTKDVTSLICGGLAETGMDYDDLILSLLADRLDFLLKSRRGTMGHIIDLLLDGGVARAPGERREPGAGDRRHAAQAAAGHPVAALIDRIASDLKVQTPAEAEATASPQRTAAEPKTVGPKTVGPKTVAPKPKLRDGQAA